MTAAQGLFRRGATRAAIIARSRQGESPTRAPERSASSGKTVPSLGRRGDAVHAVEGTLEEVVRGEASWCVVHGDALHVLRDLPDGCVSAFVTDPPYSSGGAFRGDRVKDTTAKYVSTHSSNKEIRRSRATSATNGRSRYGRRSGRARRGASAPTGVTSSRSRIGGSFHRSAMRCRRGDGSGAESQRGTKRKRRDRATAGSARSASS